MVVRACSARFTQRQSTTSAFTGLTQASRHPTCSTAASTRHTSRSSLLQATTQQHPLRTHRHQLTPSSAPSPSRQFHSSIVCSAEMGSNGSSEQVATVGGGCFWCIEAVYNQMKGVHSALSGYAGGHVENPTYEQVCGKGTGHAEVVQVKFDPSVIDYRTVLEVLFTIHDPTTKDRQGNDVGPQYRSIIMYHDEEQKKIAEEVIRDITEQKLYNGTVVTEVVPVSKFYVAEKYHQRYYENNPNQGYCAYVVGPKVAKFRSKWAKLIR